VTDAAFEEGWWGLEPGELGLQSRLQIHAVQGSQKIVELLSVSWGRASVGFCWCRLFLAWLPASGALVSLVAVSLELLSDELLALEESCSAGRGSAGADGRVSATGLVGLGVVEAWLGAVGGGGPGIVEVVVGTVGPRWQLLMPIFPPRMCATVLPERLLGCSRWVVGTRSRPMVGALGCRGVGKPQPRGACLAGPLRSLPVFARCV